MASIFSKIVAGEIPAYRIAESDRFLAFLDINPQAPGHTLVIPKEETDNIWDLTDELLADLILFAKPIAKALEQAFDCNRCGMSVIGLDVPHAHVHLIPISSAADMNPGKLRIPVTKEDFEQIQARIGAALTQEQR